MAIKSRKGVLISVSMLIITLTILSFATIQSNHRRDLSRESSELSAIDRADAITFTADTSIRKIVFASGGINTTVSGTSITFADVTGNGTSNLDSQLSIYGKFFEQFTNKANITMSNSSNLVVKIIPFGFLYTHPKGAKGPVIKLVPADTNYSSYNFYITLPAGKTLKTSSCLVSVTAGSRNLVALITDGSNTCSYSGTFSPALAGSISVNTTVNDRIVVNTSAGTYGEWAINDVDKIGLKSVTTITFLNSTFARPSAILPSVNITANLSVFGAIKTGSAVLA
ncbi:MAG: hypothetical protein V1839_01345 [archaeon]